MKRPFHNDATRAERRAVLKSDRGGTYHAFASAEAGTARGRFTAIEKSAVIGAMPEAQYPTLPEGAWSNQTVAIPHPYKAQTEYDHLAKSRIGPDE